MMTMPPRPERTDREIAEEIAAWVANLAVNCDKPDVRGYVFSETAVYVEQAISDKGTRAREAGAEDMRERAAKMYDSAWPVIAEEIRALPLTESPNA